jgi:hypothetical protein
LAVDELQKALRAALQRAFDRRTGDEVDAQRSARLLRIAVDAADAPAWQGDAVALMQPAPPASSDARWAAAFGLDAADPAPAPVLPRASARPLPVKASPPTAFGYPQVREYAAALLAALAAAIPTAGRVALALPGAAHGLDEGACIEHLLLGLVDTLAAQPARPALRELVLLESNDARRALMADKLAQLLGRDAAPAGWVAQPQSWPMMYFPAADAAQRMPAPFEQQLTYKDTLTAFVAMPFATEMLDVFQYGIQGPALRSKFKAERLDFEHFTGSIVDQIKDRIQRAHLVIADMTGANPNVFLEIGYAWGKGRPTLLLWRKAPAGAPPRPPFDVAGDSRIEYGSIGELDKALTEKLQALYLELRKHAMGPD